MSRDVGSRFNPCFPRFVGLKNRVGSLGPCISIGAVCKIVDISCVFTPRREEVFEALCYFSKETPLSIIATPLSISISHCRMSPMIKGVKLVLVRGFGPSIIDVITHRPLASCKIFARDEGGRKRT